jgi:CubicO group peptidase (beta-lactamase class C family)
MQRRLFLQCSFGGVLASPLIAAAQQIGAIQQGGATRPVKQDKLNAAADLLAQAAADGQVYAAALYVRYPGGEFARTFGGAKSIDDPFLLASISKPISAAAVMTLYDRGRFDLDDPVRKFIPEFTGEARDTITIRQLLTHVSGLPDQLPENAELRKGHAPLSVFVEKSVRTPLLFEPGSRYQYSSMGILLASEVAHRITGTEFTKFVDEAVFQPLGMKQSALGLGRFKLDETLRVQTEKAAPEAGGGDPTAQDWDWNSPYWRNLGSPWGGVHASAADVGRFFAEFLHPNGHLVKGETAALMLRNHNRDGLTPRGLGFGLGAKIGSPGCSEKTFGHGGATGTLAWADPATDTVCVALTTLPDRAANPHPGKRAAEHVAAAVA